MILEDDALFGPSSIDLIERSIAGMPEGGGLNHPIPDRRHARVELHSYPINLWDWLKSYTRFIRCAASGSPF